MDQSTIFRYVALSIGLFGLYAFAIVIYRLWFHPLAKFPGPKLTAATHLVQTYYDLFCGEGGQFPFAYRAWHEKYGPIIRINPDELHIQDSSYHETLYSPSRPVRRPPDLGEAFGTQLAAFGSPDHHSHRMRRGALNPFFSKRKVAQFAPEIQQNMNKIITRLSREYDGTGLVLNLNKMWGCLVSDTIINFSFEADRRYDFIDSPGFFSTLNEGISAMVEPVHWLLQIPIMAKAMSALPVSIVRAMDPQMGSVKEFVNELESQSFHVFAAHGRGEKLGNKLFSSLLDQDLPPEELSAKRLHAEAISIVGAGIETTMRSLTVACFHIIDQPAIRQRLHEELCTAIPDVEHMLDWDALAKLPYLTACVEESLRMTYGASHRMQRAYSQGTLAYRDYVIPQDTMVSMDNYAMAHDEEIFPHSFTYIPDRWLGDPKAPDGKQLSRYMVAFGKGSRSCTGMQLAYAEMYIAIASFFRSPLSLKARLYQTDKSDVEMARDCFAPRAKKTSQGVRIVFG